MKTFLPFAIAIATLVAASSASAAHLVLPRGSTRDFTLANPVRVSVRMTNNGDCTVGFVAKDASGHEVINSLIRPGEVRDFETQSGKIKTATAITQKDGATSAILDTAPLTDATEIRVPPGAGFLSCTALPMNVYTTGDGDSSRPVVYSFRYGSNCGNMPILIHTYLRDGSRLDSTIDPINPTRSINNIDIVKIEVQPATGGGANYSFFFTRNP
jgi:hypothetical protein